MNLIELSHRMIPGKEVFRLEARTYDVTDELPEVTHRPDIWYVLGEVTFSTHVGTHIEFPYHHLESGANAANYPLDRLVGEGAVLDFSHKEDGEAITADEVGARTGNIRQGDIIFIRTDMDRHWRTERWSELPYLTPEAIDILIGFDPIVIGTDAGGFEVPGTDYQPNHLKMFQHNIAMVESATNLAALGTARHLIFILPLPIEGIDSCPVRIVAMKKDTHVERSGGKSKEPRMGADVERLFQERTANDTDEIA